MIHVNLANAEVGGSKLRPDAATVSTPNRLQAVAKTGNSQMNQISTTINDWDCDVEIDISSDPLRLPAPLHWLTLQSAHVLTAISSYAARFTNDQSVSGQIVRDEQIKLLDAIHSGLGRDHKQTRE